MTTVSGKMTPSERLKKLLEKEGVILPLDAVENIVNCLSDEPLPEMQKEFQAKALKRIPKKYQHLLGAHSTVLETLELAFFSNWLPEGVKLVQRAYSDRGLWLEMDGVKAGELDFVLGFKNNGKYAKDTSQLEVLLTLSKENLKVVFPEKTEADFCYRMGLDLLQLPELKGFEFNQERYKEVVAIKDTYKKIESILTKKNCKFKYKESVWERKNGIATALGIGDLEVDRELYHSDDSYNVETYMQDGKTYVCFVVNSPNLNWTEVEERIDKILCGP